jgi:curli biogenesis system outer membrane secretion channel CsgG
MMSITRAALMRSTYLRAALLAALSATVSGCMAWTPIDKNDTQLVGPAPYANQTPMNSALHCLRPFTKGRDLRLGVADFVDGSGATMGNNDVNGRYFSQRPDLMLIVALSKAGVRLVNRTSTAVAEWEMRQAMDKKLGDGKPATVGSAKYDYRPIHAGDFLGSNYYIHGAVTEINWALSNDVEEYGFLGVTGGKNTYRVSIAIDLAVTNSETTEVVFARSYAKQLVGYQVGGGVFRFMDVTLGPSHTELFESNVGDKKNEPVQRALRWLIESAAYDVVAEMEGRHESCDAMVPGLYDNGPPDHVGSGGLIPFLGERESAPDPAAPVRPRPVAKASADVPAKTSDAMKPAAAKSGAAKLAVTVDPARKPVLAQAKPQQPVKYQEQAVAVAADMSLLRLAKATVAAVVRYYDGIDVSAIDGGAFNVPVSTAQLASPVTPPASAPTDPAPTVVAAATPAADDNPAVQIAEAPAPVDPAPTIVATAAPTAADKVAAPLAQAPAPTEPASKSVVMTDPLKQDNDAAQIAALKPQKSADVTTRPTSRSARSDTTCKIWSETARVTPGGGCTSGDVSERPVL